MPRPVPDDSTGWWSIRVRMRDGSRRKFMLAKQPGWTKGKKLPKKPPPEIELLARKYQDMDIQIRHGVDVSIARTDNLVLFISEFQKHHAIDHRPNSIRILNQAVKHFLPWCEFKGIETVQQVTSAVCDEYLRHRKRQGAARNTIASEKGCISVAFSRALRNKQVPENPWAVVRVPGKPDRSTPEFWSKEELLKLIDASSGWVRDVILVAVNTGGRIDSVLSLEWKNVFFDRGVVRFHSKTGPYEVPISATARDVLERILQTQKGKSIFPATKPGRVRTPGVAYVAIRAAVIAAGIPEKGRYNHILRHTFASHAIMRGVPLVTVSKWLGHASIHMTMRYAHLSPSESQRFMEGFSLGSDPLQPASLSATPERPFDQTGMSAAPPSLGQDIPPPPSSTSGELIES